MHALLFTLELFYLEFAPLFTPLHGRSRPHRVKRKHTHTYRHTATCARGAGNEQLVLSEQGGNVNRAQACLSLPVSVRLSRSVSLSVCLSRSGRTHGRARARRQLSVLVCLFRSVCLGRFVSVYLFRSDEHTHDVNNAMIPGRHNQHPQRWLQKQINFYQPSEKHCKA